MTLNDLVYIRQLKEEDMPFIFATWLRQLWYAKTNHTTLTKSSFFKVYHEQLEFLVRHHDTAVAALKDDPDTILGYLVDTEPTPFVYIKKAWRDVGIELALKRKIEK